MALITCSHCGKQMSDRADVCPHCGKMPEVRALQQKENENNRLASISCLFWLLSYISIIFVNGCWHGNAKSSLIWLFYRADFVETLIFTLPTLVAIITYYLVRKSKSTKYQRIVGIVMWIYVTIVITSTIKNLLGLVHYHLLDYYGLLKVSYIIIPLLTIVPVILVIFAYRFINKSISSVKYKMIAGGVSLIYFIYIIYSILIPAVKLIINF